MADTIDLAQLAARLDQLEPGVLALGARIARLIEFLKELQQKSWKDTTAEFGDLF